MGEVRPSYVHVIRWRVEREGRINNTRFWSLISKFVEKAEGVFEDLVGSTTLVGPIVRQLMFVD